MSEASPVASVWRQYLLGELSEAERDRAEIELLAAEGGDSRLAEAEDALVEEYLDGSLSAAERARFEQHFLAAPEHQRSLEGARLLRAAFAARGRGNVRRMPVVLAAVGLLAAAAVVAVVVGLRHSPAPPTGPVAGLTPRPAPLRVVALSLSPGRVMAAGGEARVVLPAALDVLRLELLVEDPTLTDVQVAVAVREGGRVWTGPARARALAGGATVTVDVPVSALAPGAYETTVTREPDAAKAGTYFFTVARP